MKLYKDLKTFEERKKESLKIMLKYSDRVPIIVEKDIRSQKDTPDIDNVKFLTPKDLNFSQFLTFIRKRIPKLKPDEAIFVFVNNQLVPAISSMSQLYEIHKDNDGFLYVTYTIESTFG